MCWRCRGMAVVGTAAAAAMMVCTAGVYAQLIPPGQDCLETRAGGTWLQFGGTSSIPPIPADFFFPGSQPYLGIVEMLGDPLGAANTVVERKDYADVSLPGVPVLVRVEVKELHLRSREPIIVDGPPGRAESFFDVFVTLNPNTPSQGFMSIQSTGPGGGTFSFRGREDGGIALYPRFIFVPLAGGDSIVWDPGDPPGSHSELLESVNPQPWQNNPPPPVATCSPAPEHLFWPVPGEELATTLDGGETGEHGVIPPREVEACCLPNGDCIMVDSNECLLIFLGTPQGPGTRCTQREGCCAPDPTGIGMICYDLDPLCCDDILGAISQGPNTGCVDMVIACCLPDGTCVNVDPLCCDDLGGKPSPLGGQCLGDWDGDGIDEACECRPTPDGLGCEADCNPSGSGDEACYPKVVRQGPPPPAFFPVAGEDVLTGTTGYIVVTDPGGVPTTYPIRESPNITRVIRESPTAVGTHREVASEIIEMELMAGGGGGGGAIYIRESPTRISSGHTVGVDSAASDYPADSFFDLFVEIDIPDLGVYGLYNDLPIPLAALGITAVPPLGSHLVTSANWWGSDLLDAYGQTTGYRIIEVEHILPPPPPPPVAVFPAAAEDVLQGTTGYIVVKDPGGVSTSYPIRESPNITRVIRESPVDVGTHREIASEIIEMELMAGDGGGGGAIYIRESPTRASAGSTVGADNTGTDYPADSFFDLFVEIDIPDLGVYGLYNDLGIPLATYAITAVPPLGNAYATPVGWGGVELLDVYGQPTGYQIVQVEHRLPPREPDWKVIECDCLPSNYCHVAIDLDPFCTGYCPGTEECRQFSWVDPDGTTYLTCRCEPAPPEACCFTDGRCVDLPPADCLAQGGTPQGPGTVCTQPEACCVPNMTDPGMTCWDVDPLCCDDLGGTLQGAGTVCGDQPPIACCLNDGSCLNVDRLCCDDMGGHPGFTSPCLGDLNGDGIDDACEECRPTPDGLGCEPTPCPNATEVCLPKVVRQSAPPPPFFPVGATDVLTGTTGSLVVSDPGGTVNTYQIRESPTNITRVIRESPVDVGGHREIASEIIEMELMADGGGGGGVTIQIRESPTRASIGHTIGAVSTNSDYPADSFFDLFVEIDIPDLGVYGLYNDLSIPLAAQGITAVPPLGGTFATPAGWGGVDLLATDGTITGYRIEVVQHVLPPRQPEWQVIDCECMNPNACHVALDLQPFCTGDCPLNEECRRFEYPNPVGTVDVTCRCAPMPEACCFVDGRCENMDPQTCLVIDGTPQGPGTQCTQAEGCCIPDLPSGGMICMQVDPLCCDELGGTPQGAGTACMFGTIACCIDSGPMTRCVDVDPLCCDDLGGRPGYASRCLGDLNGNGIDDACEQICGPAPGGLGCLDVPCPLPNEVCLPKVIRHYMPPPPPPGQEWEVIECECVDPSYCHIDWDGQPFCVGGCPPMQECLPHIAIIDPGMEDYSCSCVSPLYDLGDAPDSSNSWGAIMTAYPVGMPPYVPANFPTVYQAGSPPYGPLHRQPEGAAYLGADVTFENEADLLPDEDGMTNIDPPGDLPDRDGADDGVTVPLELPHCRPTTFTFTVTFVPSPIESLYVNVWFDWNRDGDWDDVHPCGLNEYAFEWTVRDLVIPHLGSGQFTFTTPEFLPWHPTPSPQDSGPIWMRITLAEQPWQPGGTAGEGGSGPAAGYQLGETEDYYFVPTIPPPPEACCLTDGLCVDMRPDWCILQEGIPQGAGTQCTAVEACCIPDPTGNSMICMDVDPLCCDDLGGEPQGPNTICGDQPPIACCLDDGSCQNVDRLCCDDLGGHPGYQPQCLGDLNGNGIDDACEDLPRHDLGDAPDSSNSYPLTPMPAYPWNVWAIFPTVYQAGSPPHGPLHLQPRAVAFFGNGVSLENEADIGPDEDGVNNIEPITGIADLDGADDGVAFPMMLPHCQAATFTYIVTVTNAAAQALYVNAWFDWNRDGDWDDVLDCSMVQAPEWAVQNQVLSFAAPGQYTVTTPAFLPWHPLSPETLPIWMRITIAERPWQPVAGTPGYGGSGPAEGYQIGETEDYYFVPRIPVQLTAAKSWKVHGATTPPTRFFISLPIVSSGTTSPGVETRSYTATEAREIEVTFSGPPLGGTACYLKQQTTGTTYPANSATIVGNALTLKWTPPAPVPPNAKRYVLCLSSVTNLTGDNDVEIIYQVGNITQSPPPTKWTTDASDLSAIGPFVSPPTTTTQANCKYDITQSPPTSRLRIDGSDKTTLGGSYSGPVQSFPVTCP